MANNTTKTPEAETEMDFGEITERIITAIASDRGLIGQFAVALDIEEDVLNDYLDRVQFPVVGAKDRHAV